MADLVDQIEAVRRQNNGHWMALLRLALKADPEGAKGILRNIEQCDSQVLGLLRELAE